jgi:hypothetical protein
MFSDMLLDIIRQLRHDREWRLEVFDKSGTIRHRFLLTAETFNQ